MIRAVFSLADLLSIRARQRVAPMLVDSLLDRYPEGILRDAATHALAQWATGMRADDAMLDGFTMAMARQAHKDGAE